MKSKTSGWAADRYKRRNKAVLVQSVDIQTGE